MENKKELRDDQFELYDLTVVVEKIEGNCTCNMALGDKLHLKGGKISMPEKKDFCLCALQSTIPLSPTKQRKNHPADWMETDARVVCPDLECKLVMRINRDEIRVLNHDDVSPVKWAKD